MRARLAHPPEPIADAARASGRLVRAPIRLVRGEVVPVGGGPRVGDALPYGLGAALGPGPEPVLARVDIEDAHLGDVLLGRPTLERYERARDFQLSDGSGHVQVRLGDATAPPLRLHDRVELYLDGPFRQVELPATSTRPRRIAYLRTLRIGDPVYVLGRLHLDAEAPAALAVGAFSGYREPPLAAVFSAGAGPLQVFDEPAFRQLAKWHALPWYRKLSVLVWNR